MSRMKDFMSSTSGCENTFSQRTMGLLTRISVTKGKLDASQASIPPSSGGPW